MASLVRQYKTDTGVRLLAQRLTRNLPDPANVGTARNAAAEVTTLQQFVRDQVRYVKDVEGVETLQTPVYTLQSGSGDCDDKATLLNTLLASIGYPTLFFAVGIGGNPYSHVVAGVKLGSRTIPLETIVAGVAPGWLPPNANPILPWNV
jgi:transglutaminase-like putative cysteine protease